MPIVICIKIAAFHIVFKCTRIIKIAHVTEIK